MLGDVFEKSERKDVAGGYYFLLVKNYPLSKKAPLAKDKLKSFGVPIPQPDPKAVAWMTAEQNAPRPKETPVHRAMGILHNGPDVHTAAYHGNPQMEPESDNGPTDTLSGGNRTTLVGSSGGAGSSTGSTAVVETVRPGDPAPAKPAGAEDTTSGTSDTATAPNADASAASSTDAATTADPAKTDAPATDSAAADAAKTAAPVAADANNNQKESSSKKKGIKKLIPW
jgi:hypothetical protein